MKRIVLLFIPFLIMMSSGCAYYNTFYNAKQFYKEAEKDRKKREKVLVVELSPEEKAERKKTGQAVNASSVAAQQEMQNYQRAIEKASRVLEFYPDSKYVDDALILLGKCFYYRRDFKKAQRKFEEIIQLYPNSEFISEARVLLAKTHLGLEEFDIAESKFLELSMDDRLEKRFQEEAKFELGGLFYEKGNFEQASENYTSTAKEAEDKLIKAMSLYRLGQCYINLKEFDKAPETFEEAVKISPNDDFKTQAIFKLGEAFSLNGDSKEAVKTFSNLLSIEFDETKIPGIKLELAKNLKISGDNKEALKWFDNIIEDHKKTDASAKSYFALGEIEEYENFDYKKAKENYDLVRSEFTNSLIAPLAKERSDNIKMMIELRNDIAKLEGRYVESDSLENEGDNSKNSSRAQRDDGPIDLSMDGKWVYYSGRDRPPPKSLKDLTEADRLRAANDLMNTQTDSTGAASTLAVTQTVALDSAAIALAKIKEEELKSIQIAQKRLALAEVLYFNFNKPDSSIDLYKLIIQNNTDSSLTTRAMYSLGYLLKTVKHDSVKADSVLNNLIEYSPDSEQATGAKHLLGIHETKVEVDSAKILYLKAEETYWKEHDLDTSYSLYDQVVTNYPESEYAPKAVYAQAWLLEKVLFEPDSALAVYDKIIKEYPDTPYSKDVKNKLDKLEKAKKDIEKQEKALADSLAKMEQMKNDSLKTLVPDSLSNTITDSTTLTTDKVNVSSAADSSTSQVLSNSNPPDSTAKKPKRQAVPVPDKNTKPLQPESTAIDSTRGK